MHLQRNGDNHYGLWNTRHLWKASEESQIGLDRQAVPATGRAGTLGSVRRVSFYIRAGQSTTVLSTAFRWRSGGVSPQPPPARSHVSPAPPMSSVRASPTYRHIPTGVLFDLIAGGGEDSVGAGGDAARDGSVTYGGAPWSGSSASAVLPWRITVHFQGCPRRQVWQYPLSLRAFWFFSPEMCSTVVGGGFGVCVRTLPRQRLVLLLHCAV